MRRHFLCFALMAVMCGAGVTAHADSLVLPNSFTTVEGNANVGNPLTADTAFGNTLQTVYGASELREVPPGSLITGLTWRLDSEVGRQSWPSTAATFAQYDIQLSMSLNAPGSLSQTFADNIGPDAVTTRSGPLTIPSGAFPGGMLPNPFGLEIAFTTPYVYNGGDLLITIRNIGQRDPTAVDAVVDYDSKTFQTIFTRSTTATIGIFQPTSIARLTVTPIPEPSTLSLLGLGACCLLGYCWRRRKQNVRREPVALQSDQSTVHNLLFRVIREKKSRALFPKVRSSNAGLLASLCPAAHWRWQTSRRTLCIIGEQQQRLSA